MKDRSKVRAYQQIQSDEARAVHRKIRFREIMDDLSSGRFIAVGVKVLPEEGAPLEFIRRHLFNFDSNIDWEVSILEISNLKYTQIRILSLKKALRISRPLSVNPRYVPVEVKREYKSGPIGMGPAVKALYVRMYADGRLKDCRTVVAIWQKMAPLLEKDKANFPMGRGLSYPSFARALKDARVQSSND